jgi:hypothetical protein
LDETVVSLFLYQREALIAVLNSVNTPFLKTGISTW